jgi:glycosyltransferase involved in cell wall biosynthesis
MEQKSVKLLLAITKSNWGGAQRYVYDIATHFNHEKNFNVIVLTGGSGDLISKLEDARVHVIHSPTLKRDISFFYDIQSLFWLYKTILKEKPDVLHVNSSKMGLFGSFIGRVTRVKTIIFTAHAWPFNESRPLHQKILFRALALLTVLFAHKTIAVSQAVITSLRAPFFLSRKMACVYTGIEPPELYPRGTFFETFKIAQTEGLHLVSIGELHMSKGYDRALIALAQCKHLKWTYHIIGSGEKHEYLEKLIARLDLMGRVILHGFIENASLYLNSFDLFLFPSRTEALGYVAIEALYSKLPIIASNAGGIPEVLFDDPYTKIIDCNDGKAFKKTLLSMLQKLPAVEDKVRPGCLRFSPKVMFAATKKTFLSQELE